MSARQRRLALLALGLLLVGAAIALVVRAFQSNLVFFLTPTQVAQGEGSTARAPGQALRVGGLVQTGSIQRDAGSLQVRFVLTDHAHAVPVVFSGVLPDLFAAGKGAIAQGRLDAHGTLQASEVLAKHDENYMPPEAQHAVDQANKMGKTLK